MNPSDGNVHEGLEDLLLAFNYDPEVKAVVIEGAGDRAFCAGGSPRKFAALGEGSDVGKFVDPREFAQSSLGREETRILQATSQPFAIRLLHHFLALGAPSVACINGDAAGFGASIALMCDVSIMADTARIGDTHVKMGLVAGDGGTLMWPLLLGMNRAKWYLMTGELVGAQEAERIGLVNWVVPRDRVREEARARAMQLANGAPLAVRWTKAALNQQIWRQMIDVQHYSFALEAQTTGSPDNIEGGRAFTEKRPPKFTGR